MRPALLFALGVLALLVGILMLAGHIAGAPLWLAISLTIGGTIVAATTIT